MRAASVRLFRKPWPWLAALLAGACCLSLEARSVGPGPMVGKAAPAFQIQGAFDETYSLEPFKGHILVMQFGASW